MKTAIIGAGLAGLACARELDRHGIDYDIFEKKDYIGSHISHAAATLRLFDRTEADTLKILKKNFHLKLDPLYTLQEIEMLSPSNSAVVKGNLGYVFFRGADKGSLENQLAKDLSKPVRLNENADVFDLKRKYDHIVVASGDCNVAKDLNLWTTSLNTLVRMATVIGEFSTGKIKMWFNTEYAKHCYCYMIANSSREAVIILTADNATSVDMEYYWKTFLTIEELTYTITETLDFEYNLGYVKNVQFDNIYFVGNAAGFTDDLIGLGVFNAVESGALAARSIVRGEDYSELIQPLRDSMEECHEFRKILSDYGNEDYDKLLAFLDLPGIKRFIYSSPAPRLELYTPIAKLYNKLRNK